MTTASDQIRRSNRRDLILIVGAGALLLAAFVALVFLVTHHEEPQGGPHVEHFISQGTAFVLVLNVEDLRDEALRAHLPDMPFEQLRACGLSWQDVDRLALRANLTDLNSSLLLAEGDVGDKALTCARELASDTYEVDGVAVIKRDDNACVALVEGILLAGACAQVEESISCFTHQNGISPTDDHDMLVFVRNPLSMLGMIADLQGVAFKEAHSWLDIDNGRLISTTTVLYSSPTQAKRVIEQWGDKLEASGIGASVEQKGSSVIISTERDLGSFQFPLDPGSVLDSLPIPGR